MAALRPLGRGLRHDEKALVLGAEVARSPARSATRCRRAAIRSSPRASRSSVASTSKKKEPAYLFIQWLNSEEISIQRVQLPYALRDPFRDIHFTKRGVQAPLAGGARTIWRRCRPVPSRRACSTCR